MTSSRAVIPRASAVCAAACLAGAELGHLVLHPDGAAALPALWPPVGILVAALVLHERKDWPPLIAAGCGAMFVSLAGFHGQGPARGVGFAVLSGFDAVAVAWLVRQLAGNRFAVNQLPYAGALVVSAAVAPMVAALASPGWLEWWLTEMNGVLVFTPVALAVVQLLPLRPTKQATWTAVEMTVVLVLTVALSIGIFGGLVSSWLRVPAYLLPLLLWPVFRFGTGGGATVAVVVVTAGMYYTSLGTSPFAAAYPDVTLAGLVLRTQGAVAIVTASLFLLASTVAERAAALAEVKTLRGFVPICAWCHKIRDDAGFWQQLEEYLNARTDVTFSHSICPTCIEHERAAIEEREAVIR